MRRLIVLTPLVLAAGCLTSGARQPAPGPGSEASRIARLEADLAQGETFDRRWRLASACLTLVDHPDTPDGERVAWAERALTHADRAVTLEPDAVQGHYYRAIAVGRVLEHSSLPNPGRIGDLEEAAIAARERDPAFRCAGPLRLLALLYANAPAWPVGPELAGEEDVIADLFGESIERAPDCPENHLAFAEFLHDLGRTGAAREHAQTARRLLPDHAGLEPWERRELEERIRELLFPG